MCQPAHRLGAQGRCREGTAAGRAPDARCPHRPRPSTSTPGHLYTCDMEASTRWAHASVSLCPCLVLNPACSTQETGEGGRDGSRLTSRSQSSRKRLQRQAAGPYWAATWLTAAGEVRKRPAHPTHGGPKPGVLGDSWENKTDVQNYLAMSGQPPPNPESQRSDVAKRRVGNGGQLQT